MSSANFVTVNVLRGRDLAIADSNGLSDPYAVVTLGRQKKKTNIIKKTLNPAWEESFVLEMKQNFVVIDVWDWDLASSDDFLGHVVVDLAPAVLDGTERWYKLGQRFKDGKENVAGEILLSFYKGGTPSAPKSKKSSNIVDEIKSRITDAQKAGGKEVDLNGCDLNKIPKIIMDSFTELLHLNLSFNKFISWPELNTFSMLEELDLTGNQIGMLPPVITELVRLRELHMNGNRLTYIPDEIGALTRLEKLSMANNQIATISPKIGRLRKLEELTLMGNPLNEIPPALGLCHGVEVLDLSCCGLTAVPGEFTYLTKLIELNLSTNQIRELPQAMGRMTRLVTLSLSDNKLTDLPISLGYCIGLAKLGAGISIERNPITDMEMIRKYKIGTDHLQDYLEKKLMSEPGFKLLEYDISRWDDLKKEEPKTSQAPQQQEKKPAPTPAQADAQLDEKIKALKKWANTTIQSELRAKITVLGQRSDQSNDIQVVSGIANVIKLLKPEMEKARTHIASYEVPVPEIDVLSPKVDMVKACIAAILSEFAMTLRGVQDLMNNTSNSKEVVLMVQFVKTFKGILDKIN